MSIGYMGSTKLRSTPLVRRQNRPELCKILCSGRKRDGLSRRPPAGAIPLADRAAELSPRDPSIGVFLWVKGRAYFTLGDYAKAIEALRESVRVRPDLWFTQAWLIAAYALASRDVEAQQAVQTFKQTFQFDLDQITQYYKEEQYQNPTLQAASVELLNGLRMAGLK